MEIYGVAYPEINYDFWPEILFRLSYPWPDQMIVVWRK